MIRSIPLLPWCAVALVGWFHSFPSADSASAGEYNRVLDVGDEAPAWEALPGVDGKNHSLADLSASSAVVVVFTCNSCPYAVDVEERLVALSHRWSSDEVALVAINVNRGEEDRLPAMRDRAESRGFSFAYLFDESQSIARQFGATRTPEFFVLDAQRRVAYMGALDDSPDGKNVTVRHVENAVDAVLGNQTPRNTETVPIGCAIRFERQRRGR